jgi:hypothetical protein
MSRLITVIPVYNGARYLRATLEAVVRQTTRPDRVIVQDNCSTDDTRQIFEPFAKFGFEWRQNERNIGSGANFNRALALAAEAEYLHLLPADDLVKPHFFERLLAVLEPVSAPAMAYSAYEVIDEAGRLAPGADLTCPFPSARAMVTEISTARFLKAQADLKTVCLPAVLIKTGGRPLPARFSEEYIQASDAVFYGELASRGFRVFEIAEALCQYRRHAAAYTSSNQRRPDLMIADEWKAMQAIGRWIPQSVPARWLWRQRQRCLLAARAAVKARQIPDPLLQRDAWMAAVGCVGRLHGWLGYLAVAAREAIGKARPGRHT